MFSDTHFHFRHLVRDRGLDGTQILEQLCERNTFFALDIGTEADDLIERKNYVDESSEKLTSEQQAKIQNMIQYSAGIWPDTEEIKNRGERIKILEDKITKFNEKNSSDSKKVLAIGECGLDHHWNPSGADGRCAEDFDKAMFEGERELFEMQLELAKKLDLPVIIHSRDAFEDTLDVLKNMGYHNGIIHCYSYGKDEARKFLDLGWYIAFGGAVTYAKKTKLDAMNELLRFVPDDRILMETDSPYLTPVPFRGQVNTPVLVEYVYNFVAAARGVTPTNLSETVDKNIKKLFHV
ncbi:TatD family hydrolase [Treponema zioleckii]|uniref:TatD family hydrolase n=1 Tax=Treponema zioleckii TaxID=331680 RepID=UPI00168B18D7|nr:TatD family hydrolase [Treponema zioleckii]